MATFKLLLVAVFVALSVSVAFSDEARKEETTKLPLEDSDPGGFKLQLDQLRSNILSLAEKAGEADAKTVQLQQQVEALQKEVQSQKKKRGVLEAQSIVAEDKARELSAQLKQVAADAAEKAVKADAKTVQLQQQIEVLQKEVQSQKKKRGAMEAQSIVAEDTARELSAQLKQVAADAAEKAIKADAKMVQLQQQIEALKKEVESEKKKRETLEAQSIVAEDKARELFAQLESTNEEQKKRIQKTEGALKAAEEELMRAQLEASVKLKQLHEVHGAWLPPWLATKMARYMAVISAEWNEHEKPVMDNFLQMATKKPKQAQKWAEPNLETVKTIFYESFEENFKGRWIVSAKEDYTGVWKYSKSEHQDYGLLASQKARRYAIVKELKKQISLTNNTIVLQFEVRFQNGLECGGAYLKFLRPPQEAGWIIKEFDSQSPYSILFGPDKCDYPSGRVLFIVKHKNPKTGVFVEHHLKVPPAVPNDKLSHVYTAVITPDNHLHILIDGVEQLKRFNFLSNEDFEPPFISSKTIADPDDKKPEDWDERAKIPDPEATKPDDWDENAPMDGWMMRMPQIEDEDAVKPDGWLDDEAEENYNELLGKWEARKIYNPKCKIAPGCGEWKRPMKRNPASKGKWHAPLIDNPNYKGIWKPRDIPNPDYFELEKPNFEPIKAIGIEIWTMQDGILFDNILIADDEKVAASYRETMWKPKYDVEIDKQKFDETSGAPAPVNMLFYLIYMTVEFCLPEEYKTTIMGFFKEFVMRPIMVSWLIGLCSVLVFLRCLRVVVRKPRNVETLHDLKPVG